MGFEKKGNEVKASTPVERSIDAALSDVRQVLNGYRGFKRLEESLVTATTARAEANSAEVRKAKAVKEAKVLEAELERLREEGKRLHSGYAEELIQFKAERVRITEELEAKLSTKIAPLQAEEVRAGKEVENLQKKASALQREIKQGQDKVAQLKQALAQLKATFN